MADRSWSRRRPELTSVIGADGSTKACTRIIGGLVPVRQGGRASFRASVTLVWDALGPAAMAGLVLPDGAFTGLRSGLVRAASGPTGRRNRG
jgi:hypothetical protein